MYAKINGTRIFFDVEGVGVAVKGDELIEKLVCFVLHGGPGSNHLMYKHALKPLSERLQLVYIDNRGSGYSDEGPQETYHIEQNVDDLEALREYLGLDSVVVMGQSYGGMTAMRYAVKYPESVHALILITTAPHYSFIGDAQNILKEKGTFEQIAIAEHLWNGSFESEEQHRYFGEVMAPLYSYTFDKSAPKVKRKGKYSFRALNEGFGGFLRTFDVTEGLKQLYVPAQVIGGRHDWITPVRHTYWIAELIPDSEMVIFEKCSHSVLKDEPDKFIAAVSDFVERRLIKGKMIKPLRGEVMI